MVSSRLRVVRRYNSVAILPSKPHEIYLDSSPTKVPRDEELLEASG